MRIAAALLSATLCMCAAGQNIVISDDLSLPRVYQQEFANPTLAKALRLDQYRFTEGAGSPLIQGSLAELPNDPLLEQQWNMFHAQVDDMWEIVEDVNPVIVGIIDSGITHHNDLENNVIAGWNVFFDTDQTDDEDCPHGTHVAGIVGAVGNNKIGVAGINWTANLMPVKAFYKCAGTQVNLANGIIWAVDHGASIINMSVQFYYEPPEDDYLWAAVRYAYLQDVLLVAASGNQHGNNVAYPAKFPEVMAVGSVNPDNTWSNFSNYGLEMDLAAPGYHILSTIDYASYTERNGTSMSCPHVVGVASVIRGLYPHLTAEEVRQALLISTDDAGQMGWDEYFGWGTLNAYKAVRLARCQADCDGSGSLDMMDFLCFANRFNEQHIYADVDNSGTRDIFDYLMFQNKWVECNE